MVTAPCHLSSTNDTAATLASKHMHGGDSKHQRRRSAYMYPRNGLLDTKHSLSKRITCWNKQDVKEQRVQR